MEYDHLLLRSKSFLITISAVASIIILFLLIPLAFLITIAGWEGIVEASANKEALSSILLSFEAGVIAATLSVLFGTPLAYILARLNFRGKGVISGLIDLPLVIPHTVAGIAILLAYNSRGPIGSLLGIGVEDSLLGVIAAMSFVSAPFAINFAREGFEAIDISLENVARSVGANAFKVFFTISIPLAMRSIIVGWLMALARAISEVGAIMIVAYHPIVSSVLVYEWFTTRGLKAAAGLSTLLLIFSLLVLVGLRALHRK